ncbi:MAG: hypothetical protein U5R31_13145 [Acidimicrobiia bacterium]|nr:hypothetical protein [Acidimicrobiia bacterium]
MTVLAAIAVGFLLLGASSHGIGMNTDSVGYQALADNLANGDLGYWGDPDFVVWPPLFPALLAVGTLATPLAPEDVELRAPRCSSSPSSPRPGSSCVPPSTRRGSASQGAQRFAASPALFDVADAVDRDPVHRHDARRSARAPACSGRRRPPPLVVGRGRDDLAGLSHPLPGHRGGRRGSAHPRPAPAPGPSPDACEQPDSSSSAA